MSKSTRTSSGPRLSTSIDQPLLGCAPFSEMFGPRHSTVTTPALPCHDRVTPLSCVDLGGGGDEDGGGLLGDGDCFGPEPGPGPGAGPGLGALDADGGTGDWGAELGVLDEDPGFDGPEPGDPPPGEAAAEPEGRCGFGFADFGLSVCLVRGAAVMGAACPADEPGADDTTP